MTLRTENRPLKRPLATSHAHFFNFYARWWFQTFFFPALPGERWSNFYSYVFKTCWNHQQMTHIPINYYTTTKSILNKCHADFVFSTNDFNHCHINRCDTTGAHAGFVQKGPSSRPKWANEADSIRYQGGEGVVGPVAIKILKLLIVVGFNLITSKS